MCEELLAGEVLNDKINKGKFIPGQILDLKFPQYKRNFIIISITNYY